MNRTRAIPAAILALAVAGLSPAASFAASQGDCEVQHPSARTDEGKSNTVPPAGQTLSRKLATCGSVLDPPAVGDPNIVEPTPKTDDPINLHPGTRQGNRP